MNTQRPSFEKKEMALSSSPYVYLPVDIPAYTVELTHRDPIDGELLQRALGRTLQRMPYLSDTLVIEGGAVYYAKNSLPMFHGFCDGQGINAFLESALYHYYCMKDGVEYDPNGIRSDSTRATEAETFEPFSRQYEVSPDFAMPERREMPTAYHLPEIVPNRSGEVLEYGFRLPSEALMQFVKANGTSPSVMLSMLVGEAIQRVHPDADAPIFVNIPVSVRRQLGCEETFKNCSSRIILPVGGTPMDALPFNERAARLRAMQKQQMSADQYRATYNMLGQMYRGRMEHATDYMEELKKPAGFMSISTILSTSTTSAPCTRPAIPIRSRTCGSSARPPEGDRCT